MSRQVAWSRRAERDLLNVIPWRDAEWICRELERYATDGIGDLRRVLWDGRVALVLFLPNY